jgi:hypothetical protein
MRSRVPGLLGGVAAGAGGDSSGGGLERAGKVHLSPATDCLKPEAQIRDRADAGSTLLDETW